MQASPNTKQFMSPNFDSYVYHILLVPFHTYLLLAFLVENYYLPPFLSVPVPLITVCFSVLSEILHVDYS